MLSAYHRLFPVPVVFNVFFFSKDHPTLCEYNDATRTFFNPPFPELLDARKALVDRLCEMYNRNAIPMLPHPSEEPEGSWLCVQDYLRRAGVPGRLEYVCGDVRSQVCVSRLIFRGP